MSASVHQLRPKDLSPDEEAKRLAVVRRYDILDTPPDGSFDRITAIAARLFSVPISIISLVDHDRIWFKSHHGLDVEQIDRGPGLCASAILQLDPWVLTDAQADPRSLANPLVAGDFGLRFYVGAPLRTHDGFNLGTLCVIDRESRPVTNDQIAHLKDLASVVMDQIELRLSARQAISDLSQAVGQKDAALRRSELLTKEIEHRVMNGLQLVSGMLNMQARASDYSDAAEQLRVAANRVGAIAQAHRHIYLSDDVQFTDCKEYLQRLCNDLSGMLRSGEAGQITLGGIEAQMPTEQIVSIGLIVSELVTNAAKHGAGEIKVAFERSVSGEYALSVSDNGSGLPATFDPAASAGLGMKVIGSLAAKLGGRLLVGGTEDAGGTKFTVLFPAR
jgi:two-component sensor histidine kinase